MRVLVIGGGAAGMMAALTAAENGHAVTLLERQGRVGRKLMATGNGRCNLTNHHVSPAHYHGGEGFCDHALAAFDVGNTLLYFAGLGLLTTAEDSGRVYPFSNMAGSVLDVLRFALEDHGIDLHTACPVTGIRKKGNIFLVRTESGEEFTADRVILAAGGAAGGKADSAATVIGMVHIGIGKAILEKPEHARHHDLAAQRMQKRLKVVVAKRRIFHINLPDDADL